MDLRLSWLAHRIMLPDRDPFPLDQQNRHFQKETSDGLCRETLTSQTLSSLHHIAPFGSSEAHQQLLIKASTSIIIEGFGTTLNGKPLSKIYIFFDRCRRVIIPNWARRKRPTLCCPTSIPLGLTQPGAQRVIVVDTIMESNVTHVG